MHHVGLNPIHIVLNATEDMHTQCKCRVQLHILRHTRNPIIHTVLQDVYVCTNHSIVPAVYKTLVAFLLSPS